jgi:hypothetical protein
MFETSIAAMERWEVGRRAGAGVLPIDCALCELLCCRHGRRMITIRGCNMHTAQRTSQSQSKHRAWQIASDKNRRPNSAQFPLHN